MQNTLRECDRVIPSKYTHRRTLLFGKPDKSRSLHFRFLPGRVFFHIVRTISIVLSVFFSFSFIVVGFSTNNLCHDMPSATQLTQSWLFRESCIDYPVWVGRITHEVGSGTTLAKLRILQLKTFSVIDVNPFPVPPAFPVSMKVRISPLIRNPQVLRGEVAHVTCKFCAQLILRNNRCFITLKRWRFLIASIRSLQIVERQQGSLHEIRYVLYPCSAYCVLFLMWFDSVRADKLWILSYVIHYKCIKQFLTAEVTAPDRNDLFFFFQLYQRLSLVASMRDNSTKEWVMRSGTCDNEIGRK